MNDKSINQIITAVEREGFSVRMLTMTFRVNQDVDIVNAVKDASKEFIQTELGRSLYAYNCYYFNWADFWSNVPNEICEKHGFSKIDSGISDFEVDWDEQLVDDDDKGTEEEL